MRRFEKISWEQANADGIDKDEYNKIVIPYRSTAGSAGYDFTIIRSVSVRPGEIILVPTGIRALMCDGEVLSLCVRSSIALLRNTTLPNGCAIIDSDYHGASNEGHIKLAFYNYGSTTSFIKAGEKVVQGIFLQYLKVDGDSITDVRTGGIGSTGV